MENVAQWGASQVLLTPKYTLGRSNREERGRRGMGRRENVQGFGGKTRRKETIRKAEA
jgi:hypothetical protein